MLGPHWLRERPPPTPTQRALGARTLLGTTAWLQAGTGGPPGRMTPERRGSSSPVCALHRKTGGRTGEPPNGAGPRGVTQVLQQRLLEPRPVTASEWGRGRGGQGFPHPRRIVPKPSTPLLLRGEESEVNVNVTRSCPTVCDPTDCTPPGSSVRRILQARILEWVAVPFSSGSSQPRT